MSAAITYALLDLAAIVGGIVAMRALIRRGGTASTVAAYGLCALVGLFVLAISDPSPLFADFRLAYYPAADLAVHNPSLVGGEFEKGVSGFVNLPVVAYLFAPFTVVGERPAAAGFAVLGLVAVAAAWWLLVRAARVEGRDRWLLLLLFAVNGPLLYSVKEGNTSHFLLLALVAALVMQQSGREGWAGVLLGLAAVIKPPFLLFGAYLLLRRRWRAASSFAAVIAGAGGLSLLIFGWSMHVRWVDLTLLRFSREPIAAFNNQSFLGFVTRLVTGSDLLQSWQPAPVGSAARGVATLLVGLVGLAAIWVCVRADTQRPPTGAPAGPSPAGPAPTNGDAAATLEFLLVVMLALLGSPLVWTHYYCWTLLPIAFLLGSRSPLANDRRTRVAAWVGVVLLSPAVFSVSFPGPLEAIYARLAVSSVLLGGVIWFVVLAWSRRQAGRYGAVEPAARHRRPEGEPGLRPRTTTTTT